jgi:hypothetical protein
MLKITSTPGQVLFVLTGWLLAGSVTAAASSILPGYVATTECDGTLGLDEGSSPCSQADANGSDDLALTLLPFAGLSANATVTAGVFDEDFTAFGVLNYSFEVVGGAPGDEVPLLVSTNLVTTVSGGGDGYAFSEIQVSTALASNVGEVTCTQTSSPCLGDPAAGFSGTFGVDATSGSVDTVHLEIEAGAQAVGTAGATAFASADPLIYVDPSFEGAGEYSIVQSPGVGNGTASAPEPGTLILICCCGPFLLFARRFVMLGLSQNDIHAGPANEPRGH